MAQDNNLRTYQSDIETRLQSHLLGRVNYMPFVEEAVRSATKTAAVDTTQRLSEKIYGQGGDKIIIRVSVKVEIERE